MKNILRALVLLLLIGTQASAVTPLPDRDHFIVGYNEAWFGEHYTDSWTTGFDRTHVAQELDGMVAGGAKVVRVFLVAFSSYLELRSEAPQTLGLREPLLENFEVFLRMAESRGLRVYATILNSTDMWRASGALRDYYWNLIHNRYGEGDAFKARVVEPILQVVNRHRGGVYALDLMNEMEGALIAGYFPDLWTGARHWIGDMLGYVKARSPWLPVTSSMGWGWAQLETSAGFYSGLGLDFYDMHVYNDYGAIFAGETLCLRAALEGMPILLGEFGQHVARVDDALQEDLTRSYLTAARSSCFAGALAWKFESADYFSYRRADDSFRPAYFVMREFARGRR